MVLTFRGKPSRSTCCCCGGTVFVHIQVCIYRTELSPSNELYSFARPAGSVESFVSAVEEPDDLMRFEDEASLASQFVVTSPALVHKYSQHLQQLECLNWSASLVIPPVKRQFSIAQNLTVCINFEGICNSVQPALFRS